MTSNKDYLSQEEINALLKQSVDDDFSDEGQVDALDSEPSEASLNVNEFLSLLEQDALGEICNITFGSAASALSTLLGKKVEITTPQVSVITLAELRNEFPTTHATVHLQYMKGFIGANLLGFRLEDALVIADLMLGGEGTEASTEMGEIQINALQEAMNQMMGSAVTSMSAIFDRTIQNAPPTIHIVDNAADGAAISLPAERMFIRISFRLMIGDIIDSSIMQLLPLSFAKDMLAILLGDQNQQDGEALGGQAATATKTNAQSGSSGVAQNALPHPSGQQSPQTSRSYGQMSTRNINVQPVQYASFSNAPNIHAEDSNLDLLLDVPLKVTVELGRTQKVIKDILELSQGSIIELDKLAGEPVDILVNNKLIAKGEVVVIDENFGVRVTDIVSQWDRMKKIQ